LEETQYFGGVRCGVVALAEVREQRRDGGGADRVVEAVAEELISVFEIG